MLEYENELYEKGITLIAGVDEVGRGPLIGPVVAAAVILPKGFYHPGIKDSKKLSEKKREELYKVITENALSIGVGTVSEEVIDEINIYEATKTAMKEAINSLTIPPEHVLIDAMKLDLKMPSTSIIKGDALSESIAAASIIAKVTRDHLLMKMDEEYPMYDLKNNKGYGTKKHLEALEKYGACKYHRKSYSPVTKVLNR
ncbi:MAG: ribonuclease HII [Tenericutes bacterium]|nr:ribonuclease HII [Mycoplasmatota bacterium]